MMEAVHRYEGTVNQVMGDGIMALFGTPLAHEDHAVRACYAALGCRRPCGATPEELRRAAGRGGADPRRPQLRRRRGALDRQRSPHGLPAVGQTTHLAARMEQLAAPGTHPAHRRDPAPGRGLRPDHPTRPGADQGARRAGRGVRAGGGRRRPHPPRSRGPPGSRFALRRSDRGAGAAPATPSTRPTWGTDRCRRGRRAGRRQVAPLLVTDPFPSRAGLAHRAVRLGLLRQGHRLPPRDLLPDLPRLLRDREPRRAAEDPGEGHGEGPDARPAFAPSCPPSWRSSTCRWTRGPGTPSIRPSGASRRSTR